MLHGKKLLDGSSDASGFVIGPDGADDVGGLFPSAEGVKDDGHIFGDTQRY